MRRYDIDWLRVIAIGLLLIYHVAIGFQSWGTMIGFITTSKPWTALWTPMAMLNVWRIPLLFFVSGMGVYFAMQQRSWKQLITERTLRIWLPFVFGMFAIVPLHTLVWRYYYKMELRYAYDPGHLWFLANIFAYVLLLSPILFYLKKNEQGKAAQVIKTIFSTPLGLLIVTAAFIAEVLLVKPVPYELYAMTRHGFFLGLLAFFFGFCFVLSGTGFWQMLVKWRWLFLLIAGTLFALRIHYFGMQIPGYMIVIESQVWIYSVLAFGHKHLNRTGKVLQYLSPAAYPVYILHMFFLYLGSAIVFPLAIPVQVQFMLVLLFTLGGCLLSYEIIKRVKWVRVLFGMKFHSKQES
ncbi:MAG: acyltransferase family protein [Cyclobacteriaceae bacterium]|nr:acyltransferase family protein [Cyclobacteriaceae bacterium]